MHIVVGVAAAAVPPAVVNYCSCFNRSTSDGGRIKSGRPARATHKGITVHQTILELIFFSTSNSGICFQDQLDQAIPASLQHCQHPREAGQKAEEAMYAGRIISFMGELVWTCLS